MTSEIPDRMYYRIKEVCTITGLKPHVLRYWEQEFRDIRPIKSSKGQRLYNKKDLNAIFTIKKLLYEKRYTIDGAKKFMSSRYSLLGEIRRELTEVLNLLKKGENP